jgi:beta-glucosidase
LFPYQQADAPIRRDIAYINNTISRLHDGENVHYLDISDVFLDADGNIPRDVMSDSLHPTTKGYELWAEAVIGPLTRLLQE